MPFDIMSCIVQIQPVTHPPGAVFTAYLPVLARYMKFTNLQLGSRRHLLCALPMVTAQLHRHKASAAAWQSWRSRLNPHA